MASAGAIIAHLSLSSLFFFNISSQREKQTLQMFVSQGATEPMMWQWPQIYAWSWPIISTAMSWSPVVTKRKKQISIRKYPHAWDLLSDGIQTQSRVTSSQAKRVCFVKTVGIIKYIWNIPLWEDNEFVLSYKKYILGETWIAFAEYFRW